MIVDLGCSLVNYHALVPTNFSPIFIGLNMDYKTTASLFIIPGLNWSRDAIAFIRGETLSAHKF